MLLLSLLSLFAEGSDFVGLLAGAAENVAFVAGSLYQYQPIKI